VEVASDLAAAGRHEMLFQYANPANPQAHYEGTGPEILEQAGRVDAFVAGLGTGAPHGGGAGPAGGRPGHPGGGRRPAAGESVLGLRSLEDGFVPPIFDPAAIDASHPGEHCRRGAAVRRLLAEEGLFVGLSSGAVLHAALRWAERVEEGRVVLLFADAGWKYLSSGAWEGTVEEAAARLNGRLSW